MIYKPSMFNYRSNYENEMIIYNSLKGLQSVSLVSEDKVWRVRKLFEEEKIEEEKLQGLEELIGLNFFVPYDFDEKLNRERRQMEYIMQPSLRVVVHTTKACNFRCKYCALDFEPEHLQQDGCDNIISFFRKNISKYERVHISWFGGEPLLKMDAIEYISSAVIDICRRAKKPYYSTVTTNGYLLTPENVDKLIKLRVYNYAVTVDGVKATHDNQRVLENGNGSFDQIIRNLEYMRDSVKSRALNVIIRTNITREIFDRLEEYYNFYNDRFGGDNRFSLFVRPAGDWGGDRVKQFKGHLIEKGEMEEVYDKLSGLVQGIKYNLNYMDLDFAGTTCNATMLHKYVFGCDGLVSKCDTCNKELAIGKMQSGKKVINTEQENQWLMGHRSRDTECDKCFFSGSCFMNACPKGPILYGEKICAKYPAIDSLLRLYIKSQEVRRI